LGRSAVGLWFVLIYYHGDSEFGDVHMVLLRGRSGSMRTVLFWMIGGRSEGVIVPGGNWFLFFCCALRSKLIWSSVLFFCVGECF